MIASYPSMIFSCAMQRNIIDAHIFIAADRNDSPKKRYKPGPTSTKMQKRSYTPLTAHIWKRGLSQVISITITGDSLYLSQICPIFAQSSCALSQLSIDFPPQPPYIGARSSKHRRNHPSQESPAQQFRQFPIITHSKVLIYRSSPFTSRSLAARRQRERHVPF